MAAIGALAPVALGCALFDASAADARRGDIEGLRKAGESQRPDAAEAAQLARAYLKGGDTSRALELYRQVLANDPNAIDAMNGIAICYDRLGQFDVSRAYYEAALAMDPQSPLLLNNYGYSLFLQGDMAGAKRFLSLAAASGDAAVQRSSLQVLARIDSAASRPLLAQPPITEAVAEGPRIVRTSNHEQRLVLGAQKAEPQMLASLGSEAVAAIVPVARFSDAEEQAIFAREERLVRAEALAQLAAMQRPDAVPDTPILPSEMQAILAASQIGPMAETDFAGFTPHNDAAPLPPLPGHLLHESDTSTSRRPHLANREAPMIAVLAGGLLVQRHGAKSAPLSILPAAEPLARKRSFDTPFESDIAGLNGFAARLHGHAEAVDTDTDTDLSERLALLQGMIERTRQA